MKHAIQAIASYAASLPLPFSQILIRLYGLYGNAATLTDVLASGFGLIARGRDYALLDLPEIQATHACPPAELCTHPESGAFRALYDCPDIPLTPIGPRVRVQCQESLSTSKPRRVSAVFWPLSSHEIVPSAPTIVPPSPLPKPREALPPSPVLWGDWPRCQLRRNWLNVVRSETVVMMRATPTEEQAPMTREQTITRTQRAHWHLSWDQRFARNARPATSPAPTITIHGLPVAFANVYGFGLPAVA